MFRGVHKSGAAPQLNHSNLIICVPDVKTGNQSHPCSRKCNVLYNITEYVAIEDLINNILF